MADAMQVGFRTVDGVQVRGADSTGPSAPSILLTALSGPSLLSSMVMGSGGAAVPILLSGPLAEWVLAPDLVDFRAIDPQATVGTPLETIEGYRPPLEVREDYPESYEGRSVRGVDALCAYPNELHQLAERLPNGKLVVVEAAHFRVGGASRRVRLPDRGLGRGRVPRGGGTWADRSRDVTSNRRR